MAKIILHVGADPKDVQSVIANLKKQIESLNGVGSKIDLGIDGKQAAAIASAAKALAELQKAQNNAAKVAQRTAQVQAQAAAKSESAIAAAAGKIGAEHEKMEAKRVTATEKSAQERIKAEAKVQTETIKAEAKISAEQIKSQTRLQAELEKTTRQEEKHEQKMEEMAFAAENSANAHNTLSVALGNIAARAFHLVIQKITQALREAVTEMKNVDTELVNISKVSGKTGAELDLIGEKAYDTASKYGVSASEYLSSVYQFQKAGMGDSSEALGELAVKTQLVGDTTMETASKFLLSTNAAWGLNGSVEALNKVIDEADYINNNYATSLDKLADGMPVVASTAANMNMTIEETFAVLGTITAKTQETGRRAATAWRALSMNLAKELGVFTDEYGEEIEVTEEGVKTLTDALKIYGSEAIKTAIETGKVIDPMRAVESLAQAYKDGLLTDIELQNILMGLGGKLRTNQIIALVKDLASETSTYKSIMEGLPNAAGTADREIELMMSGWERKTQKLKNTWTEFVADIVNTDTIKGAIDELTVVVNALDEALVRANNPFSDSEETQGKISQYRQEYVNLLQNAESLTATERSRLEYLEKQLDVLRMQQAEEEKAAARKLQRQLLSIDPWTGRSQDELYAEELRWHGEQIGWTGSPEEYQASMQSTIDAYSEYYNKVIQVRDAGLELTQSQKEFISDYEDMSAAASAEGLRVGQLVDGYWSLVDASGNIVAYAKDTATELDNQINAAQRLAEINAEIAAIEAESDTLDPIKDYDRLDELAQRWAALDEERKRLEPQDGDLATAAQSVADSVKEVGPNLEPGVVSAEALKDALVAAAVAAGQIEVGGLEQKASGGVVSGGRTLVNELGPELINDRGRTFIANGGRPGVVNLSRGAVVLPAHVTKAALRGGPVPSRGFAFGSHNVDESKYTVEPEDLIPFLDTFITSGSNQQHGYRELFTQPFARVDALAHEYLENPEPTTTKENPYTYYGPYKKDVKTLAKELSSLLSNLEKQATLAGNEQDWARQAEIYEQMQEAIKQMVDDYREAGYADDSDEILDLLNKNYDIANKQLTLYQTKWDELIKALDSDTAATEAANKLAEKQQAVDEAREALANAQRQRTVRIYNAATGQWEWVADQSKISSAQKSVESAEKNYTDTVKSEALAELKRLKDSAADLTDVVLGPALSTVAQMAESTMEFQNFARALDAVYGVGTFLNSTEGTTKALSTVDSHDTVYSFNGLKLTDAQAQNMTVAELAKSLSILNLTV